MEGSQDYQCELDLLLEKIKNELSFGTLSDIDEMIESHFENEDSDLYDNQDF